MQSISVVESLIRFPLSCALATDDALPQMVPSYLDVDKLEKEFILTSAEHVLSLAGVKWISFGMKVQWLLLFFFGTILETYLFI